MGRIGEDQKLKGRGLIAIDKVKVLERFVDLDWMKLQFPDAVILDVEYCFDRNAFVFKFESEMLGKTRDGDSLPVIIPKPPLGKPPDYATS